MKTHLKRTGHTNVTNDELMILDFLALDGAATIGTLKKESYPIHRNISYTHHLSEIRLIETLREWEKVGWIYREEKSYGMFHYMTLKGGEIWEQERLPQWQRYCMDSSYSTDDDQEYLEIYCLDQEIGRAFAHVALECDLYRFNLNELTLVEATSEDFIYWKLFQQDWAWKVQLKKEHETNPCWKLYEERRVWWRTLEELQIFLPLQEKEAK